MPSRRPRYELIRLRKAAGLSRERLAQALGVGYTAVWRIENGFRDPSIDMMAKWVKALDGATPEMFITKALAA